MTQLKHWIRSVLVFLFYSDFTALLFRHIYTMCLLQGLMKQSYQKVQQNRKHLALIMSSATIKGSGIGAGERIWSILYVSFKFQRWQNQRGCIPCPLECLHPYNEDFQTLHINIIIKMWLYFYFHQHFHHVFLLSLSVFTVLLHLSAVHHWPQPGGLAYCHDQP